MVCCIKPEAEAILNPSGLVKLRMCAGSAEAGKCGESH